MPRRFNAILTALIVTAFSLLLLVFVGYGETARVYPKLMLERVAALAEVIRSPLVSFADTGLPLNQFAGFESRVAQVLTIEPAIQAIALVNMSGDPVLGQYRHHPADTNAEVVRSNLSDGVVRTFPEAYELTLPVRGKFGSVGALILSIDKDPVQRPIAETILPLVFGACGAVAFLLLVGLISLRTEDRAFARRIELAFGLVFFALLTAAAVVMVTLLADGIKGKTEGLSRSLAERLSAATEIGVHPRALSGVEAAFRQYKEANSEIYHIYLLDQGRVSLSTDDRTIGMLYEPRRDLYTAVTELAKGRSPETSASLMIVVTVPSTFLFEQVWRAGKNFVVLFIACGLVALTLIGAGRWMGMAPAALADNASARLELVKPAYFMGVFIDALVISFLPVFAAERAVEAGFTAAAASLPFTVYFIALTVTLLPTGWFAARYSIKPLFIGGILLAAGGLLLLVMVPDFYGLLVARGLSGAGQGILMIATQSYALAVTPPENRTQAAAVQVFGFNGGLLAGSAIGGLLAAFAPVDSVFLVGTGLGLGTLLYVWACLPDAKGEAAGEGAKLVTAVKASFTDWEFLKTCFLVGAVSKFVLAGVIMFAMPLLLSARGYGQEDIGQLLMLYAVATLLSVPATAKYVDRLGDASKILVLGGLLSGTGVVLLVLAEPVLVNDIGVNWLGYSAQLLASDTIAYGLICIAMLAVVMLGIAQGMLAAPAIAHISGTQLAHQHGRSDVIASYRLAERSGHIAGPFVVSKMMSAAAGSMTALALVGLGSVAGALLFAVSSKKKAAQTSV